MWKEILNEDDVNDLLESVNFFHDSCIKELKYYSGAFVDDKLLMYPVNDQRRLIVAFQQQSEDHSLVLLEFTGTKYLQLWPIDEEHSCEILNATILIKEGLFFWIDSQDGFNGDLASYEGTVICSQKLRWLICKDCLGEAPLFISALNELQNG